MCSNEDRLGGLIILSHSQTVKCNGPALEWCTEVHRLNGQVVATR